MSETESEDDDLKQAIALSLSQPSPHSTPPSSIEPGSSQVKNAFAGLDRKAMEQERLARLAARNGLKRERPISPPALSRPNKAARLNEGIIPLSEASTTSAVSDNASVKASSHNSRPDLQYPNGVVKKTWAFGHERTGNDVKIEEVLERSTLKIAVLSAFQWDEKWVFSKVDFPRTKLVFVAQGKTAEERNAEVPEHLRGSLDLCFPPMDGVNCMHSKLMLLFHPQKLRVVVPSANLLAFDWGESGTMENSVFMIDLPRFSDNTTRSASSLPSFGAELYRFISRQGMRQNVKDGVLKHDWSGAEGLAFVHTIGGATYASQDHALYTGFMALNAAVRRLGLRSTADTNIDFAASSIGSLNDTYLRTMHAAARGQITIPASAKAAPGMPAADLDDKFRIYFPAHETVTSSRAGAAGTICIDRKWFNGAAFPRHVFRDYSSVREGLLSHCKVLFARGFAASDADSKAEKSAHEKRQDFFAKKVSKQEAQNKTTKTDRPRPAIQPAERIAYAYVGSANMSESAWGKLGYDKTMKEMKMSCRNWECGVLVPVLRPQAASSETTLSGNETREVDDNKEVIAVDSGSETESEDEGSTENNSKVKTGTSSTRQHTFKVAAVVPDKDMRASSSMEKQEIPSMDVFSGIVDVPFKLPGERYNGRQPWYFKEHFGA